ncbi:MAG: ABC transporter permease [Hyphomicrobiales bacterium]|nr:ABC transporter permease [Hyphomicrobiales bacterium]
MARLNLTTIRILALLAVFVVIVLFFSTQIDNYLNARLFNRISSSVAIILLISVGQAVVVLTRNIDLSVGSIVGFVAYFVGLGVGAYPDFPAVLVPVIAIALGACFGAFNGFLVSRFNLPSIIVTLATLALFRSLAVQLTDGSSVTTASLPGWVTEFARADAFVIGDFRVRWMVVISVVVALAVHLFLTRFRAGRQFYAIGSNPEAAKVAGINVRATVMQAFVISGALAGLAGFMYLSRFGNITVVAGLGLELKSVAAVVVGGVNIFGGSGSVIGVLIGASLIDLLETSLVRWALVSEFWRDAVLGMLILLAVVTDTFMSRRLVARPAEKTAAAVEAPAAPRAKAP